MTALVSSQFVSPSSRYELNGELGLDLHEIAKTMGLEFSKVKRKYDELKKLNEIDGTPIWRTVEAGFTTQEIESAILDLDNAKLLVTQLGGKLSIAFCKHLIQCEKKLDQTQFQLETLFADPRKGAEFMLKVAELKEEKDALAAQLPRLEAERDQAIAQRHLIDDRRTASAMGTASALKKKNQVLNDENQALRSNLSQQNPNQAISFEAYRILTGVQEMSSRHKGLMFKRLAEAGWEPEFKFIGNDPYPTKCFPKAAFDSFFNRLESFFGGL